MKNILKTCASLALLFTCALNADTFKTSQGDLEINEINHASTKLTWNKKNILLDPVGDMNRYKDIKKIDLILLTDIHGDHLDIKTLELIVSKNTKIIAPMAVYKKLSPNLKELTTVLNNGKNTSIMNIKIEAVAMYNLPESKDAKHVKGRGNGYVLTFANSRVYFSGDSADIKEMRELKNIDIAYVAMNIPYTMTVQKAASAVLDFKPRIVYPYHYRGKVNGKRVFSDVNEFKKLVNEKNKDIKVVLKDWYK